MDIGPTELPVQPILPTERVRRVEETGDPRQQRERQATDDEPRGEDEQDTPRDSVDVSDSYRTAHPEMPEAGQQADESPVTDEERGLHIDIEA